MSAWLDTLGPDQRTAALARLSAPTGRAALHYIGDNPAETPFAAWLAATDDLCRRRHGFSIFDLPDHSWRDHYDDELDPTDALTIAIEHGI